MGAWAFGEAMVVPIVPDVLLYPLVVAAPRRVLLLFGSLVVGALLGTALLSGLVAANPALARGIVLAVPGIDEPMLADAADRTRDGDPASMVVFGAGTPLKAFTIAWASGDGSALELLAGAIVNRTTRIGPGAILAAVVGGLAWGRIRRRAGPGLVLYLAIWAVFYWRFLGLG